MICRCIYTILYIFAEVVQDNIYCMYIIISNWYI